MSTSLNAIWPGDFQSVSSFRNPHVWLIVAGTSHASPETSDGITLSPVLL
jgi:hypothetical protein